MMAQAAQPGNGIVALVTCHHPINGDVKGTIMFRKLSDLLLEIRIANAAKQDMKVKTNWKRFVCLVNQRSYEQIKKMELERGIYANR
jgi:hypothetical protein